VQSFLIKSYATCDLIADLGICMRERLIRYPGGKRVTLTPWALEEPPQPLTFDVQERKVLFDDSHLGLLYSGNFGKAHCFEKTIKLARVLREQAIFAYSARGVGLSALKDELGSDDKNIRFVEFASPEHLSARLSAPDIHIVSLRENWTGTVVPSKFFGAIAVGRPVLFEGSEKSCIAEWIRQYKVGWVLTLGNMEKMKSEILAFSENVDRKQDMFKHCWRVYQENFSKNAVISNWVKELQSLKPQ
jgi:glycosyltransferase involved in cell wall biosynthesis